MTDNTAIAEQLALLMELFNKRFDRLEKQIETLQETTANTAAATASNTAALNSLTSASKHTKDRQTQGPTVKFTVEELFDVPELKQPKPAVEILMPQDTETAYVAEPTVEILVLETVTSEPDPLLLVIAKTEEPNHVRREVVETVASKSHVEVLEAGVSMSEPVEEEESPQAVTSKPPAAAMKKLLQSCNCSWSLRTSSEWRRGVMIQDYG
uniref:Uncharacterized protein n=1 Tax=Noccaea caerulescens TaxID=107243 RepID=A0A1J3INW4_NOCCA